MVHQLFLQRKPQGVILEGSIFTCENLHQGVMYGVQAFCFADMAHQAPLPSLSEDKYVALVSGLGLGDDAADPLKLSLLVDYLVGSLASNEEQTRVSKVSHLRFCTIFQLQS